MSGMVCVYLLENVEMLTVILRIHTSYPYKNIYTFFNVPQHVSIQHALEIELLQIYKKRVHVAIPSCHIYRLVQDWFKSSFNRIYTGIRARHLL